WADQASLDLLQYLSRNTRSVRLMLLATYRDDELDRQHPLTAALTAMNRERLFVRIPLQRLSERGTHRLMTITLETDEVPDEAARLIHAATQGTPYFVEEVLRSLVEAGAIRREAEAGPGAAAPWRFSDLTEIRLPSSVRELIDQRLARLSPEALDVL